MEVTDSTKTIVGVTFGFLYEQMYDDKRRNNLIEEVNKFTQEMLLDPSIESKVIRHRDAITRGTTVSLRRLASSPRRWSSIQVSSLR
jgi:hypothetical protein